jgi:transposase InsO family protein
VGISRATFYRRRARLKALARGVVSPSKAPKRRNKARWGEAEKQLVLALRRANKTWGKAKIAAVLERDHKVNISESTVGRILLFLREKHLITRARSRPQKRRRDFTRGHARPWKYKKYNDISLGERIQIDHMSATKNGVAVKHFMAWERKSKHIHAQIYSNAKATSARKFLRELVEIAPYQILSIQVDGGSEFMAEFETECEALKIPLKVLPPSKPKYNGGVERANRTFREDFYEEPSLLADSLGALRFELKKAVVNYNTYRPHSALDGQTPMEYLRINQAKAA